MRWRQFDRANTPLLLIDQLTAWRLYREGFMVSEIARALKRYPTETRAILFGKV